MQVADAYLSAFTSRDDRSRMVAIVTTVAVHVLIAYGIAMSTGLVPSFKPPPPTEWVVVPEKEKPPVQTVVSPFNPSTSTPIPPGPKEPEIDEEVQQPTAKDTGEITSGGGGGTREAIPQSFTEVRLLSGAQPDYPSGSRIRSEEGVVIVRITVTPYGTIGDVQLEKSSGYARLDEAALKAVRAWRFAPARRGSEAIASSVLVPVKFEIK
jgi:periplasmic protein TonB